MTKKPILPITLFTLLTISLVACAGKKDPESLSNADVGKSQTDMSAPAKAEPEPAPLMQNAPAPVFQDSSQPMVAHKGRHHNRMAKSHQTAPSAPMAMEQSAPPAVTESAPPTTNSDKPMEMTSPTLESKPGAPISKKVFIWIAIMLGLVGGGIWAYNRRSQQTP